MRQERTVRASIFDLFAEHEIGRELKAMSQWLDEHRDLLSLVTRDLPRHGFEETGREGLPAEAVLRCALLKQYRQLSYQELAFHLEDTVSFRAFARLPWGWSPKKSVLHKTIRAETWEEINRVLLASARQNKLESGELVRVDSTVTAALLHEPSDSSLLWDAMRVMVHLLQHADALGSAITWHNHCRAAKKRARAIQFTRGRPKRIKHYRELLRITRTTLSYLQQAAALLALAASPAAEPSRRTLAGHGLPLPAADRTDHRPNRAAGPGRRGGTGRRQAG
jgi:IS5 family transposase